MARTILRPTAIFHLASCAFVLTGLLLVTSAGAQQIDIQGPIGSGRFGATVTVLPNGNIVVTDPDYSNGASSIGAVYLYTSGGTLINSFTGTAANDSVGGGGVTVLTNGNFVISSPTWNNGAAIHAGASTWVNGNTGLAGSVSAANSLVGTAANDLVGSFDVALSDGNYVVVSPAWSNGTTLHVGAVTWANGSTGLTGMVPVANSLIGTTAGDYVGGSGYPTIGPGELLSPGNGVTSLSNGNYVVISTNWNNGSATGAGAVTLANGSTGSAGTVSTGNSLVGTTSGDSIGSLGITALNNGNFVVCSPDWHNGSVAGAGAATWVNGVTGLSGAVSATNSLVGTQTNDNVCSITIFPTNGVTALSNGNYVVASSHWANGIFANSGAATWGDGNTGVSGAVSATNSLVGDYGGAIGSGGVIALTNGNYVVASPSWTNIETTGAGAVTWGDGGTGLTGSVSTTNSLVGTSLGDEVGGGGVYGGVTALSNGNYVVASPQWNNVDIPSVGAVTWADGSAGLSGPISATNSLVGTQANDQVGWRGVTALSNGNYVVASPNWSNGASKEVGAATWADGSVGLSGTTSPANSLIGTTPYEQVGSGGVTALTNGDYVVASPEWADGTIPYVGAVTWADGSVGLSGTVSPANSLFGTHAYDHVAINAGVAALPNGNYVVVSPYWANDTIVAAGAVSLGRGGSGGLVGPILATNSMLGTVANGGQYMVFAYDATRDQLVVGQPAATIISLFKADQLFTNGFE